jgi:HAD superfamily hydrolase (TIGR01484 family)
MKSIQNLTKTDLENIKLLCFDCDGVTIKEGTFLQENQGELIVRTAKLTPEMTKKINSLKNNFYIMFSSGRHPLYLARMYETILWDKVILQGENGLLTVFNGKVSQFENYPMELLKTATKIKADLRRLAGSNNNVNGFEPKQFLISLHCQEDMDEVRAIVDKHDTDNEFFCLWSGEAFDIAPRKFNKGNGLKSVVKKLNLKLDNVLAVGNDPNDKEMVEESGISVTTDPESIVEGADFITDKRGVSGGEEIITKILELSI